ncbi:MAG: hypothetical protein AAF355_11785 [Myxococcota bacterium]
MNEPYRNEPYKVGRHNRGRRASGTFRLALGVLFVSAVLATAFVAPSSARAYSCGVVLSAEEDLRTSEEEELDRILREAQEAAQRWHRAWAVTLAGGIIGSGVQLALPQDREDRWGSALGVVPPMTGFTLQFATPLAALRLDSDLEALRTSPPADCVAAKRALLLRYARSERKARNWFAHAGPIFLNTMIAGTRSLFFDQQIPALVALGIGLTLSELKVWTSPRVASGHEARPWARALSGVVPLVAPSTSAASGVFAGLGYVRPLP